MQIFRFCLLKERTVIMNIQQNRITALYCRLSRDDDFGGDSVSIQTQKTMLSQYARDNGFTVTENSMLMMVTAGQTLTDPIFVA